MTQDLTCIEIHLLEGLENAATTFGLSALAVAIITWILLTCSQGDKTSPHSCSCEEKKSTGCMLSASQQDPSHHAFSSNLSLCPTHCFSVLSLPYHSCQFVLAL